MQKREKILMFIVLAIAGVFVLAMAVDQYLFKPAALLDRRTSARMNDLNDLMDLQNQAQRALHAMQQLAGRTYAEQPDQAAALSGARLTELLKQAELDPGQFARTPISPRRLRGGLEVGWSVRGRGPLSQVIDLLYLISQEPVIHRIDGLTMSPGDQPGHISVQFRFVTLVIQAVAPPADRSPLVAQTDLTGPSRQLYAGIVNRDLFRPYIPKPPQQPTQENTPDEPVPQIPAGTGPEQFRVVSLSQWGGTAEVHVHDANEQQTRRYSPGDTWAGGRIVMVDYRRLPLPNNPMLYSDSRVILKIDSSYWAIERGQTLADRYQLSEAQLPDALANGSLADQAGSPQLENHTP